MPTYKQKRSEDSGLEFGDRTTNAELWRRLTGLPPTLSSATWSLANRAVYTPIWMPLRNRTHMQFAYVVNGATVSGLVQMGIYAPDSEGKPGVRLAVSVPTLQAGINSVTACSMDDEPFVYLSGRLFYIATVFNNIIATVQLLAALTVRGDGPIMGGISYQDSAWPLPEVATPVLTPIALNVPVVGF